MVITRKENGEPRRTVDLSPLNKHCVREVHATRSPFELAKGVPERTWQTVTDAWNGFHSVPLKEEDRHLTTGVAFAINMLFRDSLRVVTDTIDDSMRCFLISNSRNGVLMILFCLIMI